MSTPQQGYLHAWTDRSNGEIHNQVPNNWTVIDTSEEEKDSLA